MSEVFDFVHPDDRDDFASMFVRMVTGAVTHLDLRYRVRHADGHWVTVDSRAQAVLDAEGHFAGAVVVSRDITDKLESEQRLQVSRDAAEQASRAKSDFLSRMSHELRTPLNSILGFAQLLQMDELPAQQADAVDHILRAGRHLLDLIDEVLDIARIESGHLELAMAPVRVAEIVSDAVELTSPMAARAEVVMRSSVDPRHEQVVDGRPPAPDAGPAQPAVERGEVQPTRRAGGRDVRDGELGAGSVWPWPTPARASAPRTSTGSSSPSTASAWSRPGSRGPAWAWRCRSTCASAWVGALTVESVAEVGSTFVVELPEPGADGEPGCRLARRGGFARRGAGAGAP